MSKDKIDFFENSVKVPDPIIIKYSKVIEQIMKNERLQKEINHREFNDNSATPSVFQSLRDNINTKENVTLSGNLPIEDEIELCENEVLPMIQKELKEQMKKV